jgi:hypothetical protein
MATTVLEKCNRPIQRNEENKNVKFKIVLTVQKTNETKTNNKTDVPKVSVVLTENLTIYISKKQLIMKDCDLTIFLNV